MVTAIVLAGGVGKRMGADIPKQFIDVFGKPIIVYTLEKFDCHPEVDLITVVCVEPYIETIKELCRQHKLKTPTKFVAGGEVFQESLKNGVFSLRELCSDEDIVIVHMGIAPMVTEAIISDSIAVCKKHGNAFSANPSYYCMCEKTGDNSSSRGLDRDVVYGLNTPQTFKYGNLYDLYMQCSQENVDYKKIQHISTLMLERGLTLHFSASSGQNIKITTKDDLDLFMGQVLLDMYKKTLGECKK